MQPSDLGLPAKGWREGQWEAIAELASRDEPYLLLEAPTGAGKSIIAAALGRLLKEEADQTVLCVGTKQLQEQYVASFHGQIVQAKGRGNFICNVEPSKTADAARCTVGVKCDLKHGGCAYYDQKHEAMEAPETVLNYPYYLALANYGGAFTDPALLVCDEAHLLEEELRRFASATIRRSHWRQFGAWPRRTDVSTWRKMAESFRVQRGTEYRQYQRGQMEDLDEEEQRYARALKSVYEASLSVLQGDEDNWVLDEQPWGVVLRPVWVAPFTSSLILRHAQKILFMSATILDKDLFCRQLGLPPDKTAFVRMDSTFPVASRPLYYQPSGRVKTADLAVLSQVVKDVDAILDRHQGQHGLIHTVSYKLAEYIMENSRHGDRLVTHRAADRAAAIASFGERPGGVLVSPSVTTGVDLPYDACSFQIIAKLAFPDLADRQIKQRMKLGPDGMPNSRGQSWYNWATACNLVQAYGRGMRAPDDNCTTYLLDASWDWFRHTVREMLPSWFTSAIKRKYAPGATTSAEALLQKIATRRAS